MNTKIEYVRKERKGLCENCTLDSDKPKRCRCPEVAEVLGWDIPFDVCIKAYEEVKNG